MTTGKHQLLSFSFLKEKRAVTTVLSPKARDKPLRMHGNTAKEIRRSTAPSNRYDDLTYATSSPEADSESSKHEQHKVQTAVTVTNLGQEVSM